MRVGVDGRSLVAGEGRGVAHYTSALVSALADAFPGDEWHLLIPERRPGPLPRALQRGNVFAQRTSAPSRLVHGLAALTGRPRVDRLLPVTVDLVWVPAPAPLAISPSVPYVLTVHDLSWELAPRDFTPYERAWHRAARPRRLARRADRVLCVSDGTRACVLERWRLEPELVTTVRSGPGQAAPRATPGQVERFRRAHGLPRRYLAFVGTLEPRKGPDVLAAAFARARAAGLDEDLVVAGEGRLAGRLRSPGVRLLGRLPSGDLPALYAGAVAVVVPSWLEGFGFVPLEALAQGTPPIVSDLPELRETLGPAAVRVAPGDADALAGAILDVARDQALRVRVVAAGAQRLTRFSWERAARETHAVLAEAAG